MALRGKGLAWLPDCQIEDELKQGKLIAVDRKRWHIPYQIRLYRNQAQLHQRAEAFGKAFHSRLRSAKRFGHLYTAKSRRNTTHPEI